jgi:uncharacterized protein YgiM (DUF1202 family)
MRDPVTVHMDVTAESRARLVARLGPVALLVLVMGACGSSGHGPPAPKPTVVAPTTVPVTTTAPSQQTRGPRTVLSPTGLHLRAAPSTAAKILGTAGQGAELTVLGRSVRDGGWFEVKGATVTGWITSDPALSASGTFKAYASAAGTFNTLYPATWTSNESLPGRVTFSSPSSPLGGSLGAETITVSSAASVAKLGRGPAGYHEIRTESVIVCGVTSRLVTYAPSSPTPSTVVSGSGRPSAPGYVSQIRLALSAHVALGIDGHLSGLPQLQDVRNFANSVTFPFPQCQG